MKKALLSIVIVLIIFSLLACKSEHTSSTVAYGVYVMVQEGTESIFFPSVIISEEGITFSYNMLSSYLNHGTYTISDGILTMTTDDNKYVYVFQIEEDNLIFQQDESSAVSLTDGRFGVKVTDKAVFKRRDEITTVRNYHDITNIRIK